MEFTPADSSDLHNPRSEGLPLSSSQQQLWFLDQLEPGDPTCNLAAACRLTGLLDLVSLEKSLNEMVRRHETLRMVFPSVSGKPLLIIQPNLFLDLNRVDLRNSPLSQQLELCRSQVVEQTKMHFDLERGPLVRCALFCLAEANHILLIVMHNIVSDDASFEIFFRELAMLYEANANGEPNPLPELTCQYTDFSLWQRKSLEDDCHRGQRDYWRQKLSDCPPGLALIPDHPRTSGRTYRGATHPFLIPIPLSESLRSLCDQYQVSLSVLFLAAFKFLLYRYTEQEDLVVGSTVRIRFRPEFESLIGCCSQSLPLRTSLSGDPAFRELLLRVQHTVSESFSNQDISLEEFLKESHPGSSLDRPPLFRIGFEWRASRQTAVMWRGLQAAVLEFDSGLIQQDLVLEVVSDVDEIRCRFNYSRDLFEPETMERMAGHLRNLLEKVTSNPLHSISRINILSDAELQQLLYKGSEAKVEEHETAFVHELFAAQAARTPDSPAVCFQGELLTYRELDHRANQLARHLQTLGVQPEVPVGICLERSANLVVAILATLKAGGACLPLDPGIPPDRLAFMVTAAKSPVILTETRFFERLDPVSARLVGMDDLESLLKQYSKEPPIHGLKEESLAHVFFTSGSTGDPKAVMWNHRKQSKSRSWAQTTFQLSEQDRHLMKSSLGFTPLNLETFWPLLTGARLIIAPLGVEHDTAALVRFMAEHRITITNFVPSVLKVILEEPELTDLVSLRQVICFGEALPAQLEDRFFERLSAELCVIYGATEAPSSTYRKCVRGQHQTEINIGRPLAGKQVYILNSCLQMAPIGVPGEICIGGEGLARGYLNRPGLTAERFISNPFSEVPGARIYRTGDRARYLRDGSLEFLGRLDQQVKIRGYRVEPREIEIALDSHPAIREGLVMTRESAPGEQQLVAYVVPLKGEVPSLGELRRFLRQKLPIYMVPSAYGIIDRIPLNAAGKLDRKALPAPVWDRSELEADYLAPRTPLEELLTKIWSELLRVERVGIRDNFFDLGGHSLLATQLVSRVRKEFQVEIPLRALFETPSVEGLAVAVLEALAARMGPADIPQLFS